MAERVPQNERQEPKAPRLRLMEGEKNQHFIELEFHGLKGTVLPSVGRLKQELLPLLDDELIETLASYLEGMVVVLPSESDNPNVLVPLFQTRKWRKNEGFQIACEKVGISLPHSIKEIRTAWFRKIVKFTRVPGIKERKFTTETQGEKMRRKLSASEQVELNHTKRFVQELIHILIHAEKNQVEKEIRRQRKEMKAQIATLVEEKKSLSDFFLTTQRELFLLRDQTEEGYEQREIDLAISQNREKVTRAILGLDHQIFQLQAKLRVPEKEEIRRMGLSKQLEQVWESMRLRGELE